MQIPKKVANSLLKHLQKDNTFLSSEKEKEYEQMVQRYQAGEPLDYILGEVPFLECFLRITPDVLIPRPETEILADMASRQIRGPIVWDLCTGSGCLGLSVKKKRPELEVVLSDLSPKALALARENARSNQLDVEFLQGDLFQPFDGRKCDAILCNPPYISLAEYETLDPSVRLHEPKMALVGGEKGSEFYERLAGEAPSMLNPGGQLFLEIGYNQGHLLDEIFLQSCWKEKKCLKDWSGHDRFFILSRV